MTISGSHLHDFPLGPAIKYATDHTVEFPKQDSQMGESRSSLRPKDETILLF